MTPGSQNLTVNKYPLKERQESMRKDKELQLSMHRSESYGSILTATQNQQDAYSPMPKGDPSFSKTPIIIKSNRSQLHPQAAQPPKDEHQTTATLNNTILIVPPSSLQIKNIHEHKIDEAPEEESYSNIHRGSLTQMRSPDKHNQSHAEISHYQLNSNQIHDDHHEQINPNQLYPPEEEKQQERVDYQEESPQFGHQPNQNVNDLMKDRRYTFGGTSPLEIMSRKISQIVNNQEESKIESNVDQFQSPEQVRMQRNQSDILSLNILQQNSIAQPTDYQFQELHNALMNVENQSMDQMTSLEANILGNHNFDSEYTRGVTENIQMNQNNLQNYLYLNLQKQISEKIRLTVEELPDELLGDGDHLKNMLNKINEEVAKDNGDNATLSEDQYMKQIQDYEQLLEVQQRQHLQKIHEHTQQEVEPVETYIEDNYGNEPVVQSNQLSVKKPHSQVGSPNAFTEEQHQLIHDSHHRIRSDMQLIQAIMSKDPSSFDAQTLLKGAMHNIIRGTPKVVESQGPSFMHTRDPSQAQSQTQQIMSRHSKEPSEIPQSNQQEPVQQVQRIHSKTNRDQEIEQERPLEEEVTEMIGIDDNTKDASMYRRSDTTKSGKKKKKKSKKKKKKKGANNITIMESYYGDDSVMMDEIESKSFKSKSRRSGKSQDQKADEQQDAVPEEESAQPAETNNKQLEEQIIPESPGRSHREMKKLLAQGLKNAFMNKQTVSAPEPPQTFMSNLDEEQRALIKARLSEGLRNKFTKSQNTQIQQQSQDSLELMTDTQLPTMSHQEMQDEYPVNQNYELPQDNEEFKDDGEFIAQHPLDGAFSGVEVELMQTQDEQEQQPIVLEHMRDSQLRSSYQQPSGGGGNFYKPTMKLQYEPPHERQKKFRQQKIASLDIGHSDNHANSQGQFPSVQFNSRNETDSAQSLVDKPVQQRRIQDGIPYFNQSVGRQNFQAFASQQQQKLTQAKLTQKNITTSQTSLPEIQVQHSPINPSQQPMTPIQNQKHNFSNTSKPQLYRPSQKSSIPQLHEEFKELHSSDRQLMTMKSEGNLGFAKPHNNFLKSDHSYQIEDQEIVEDLQDDQQIYDDMMPSQNPEHHYENDTYEGSLPPSRGSSTRASRPNRRQNDPIDSHSPQQQMKIVRPLIDTCKNHPKESIKYFCRDANCMRGLCPDCIIEHSKHDFIAANELAALEIKQVLKQAQRKCKNQVRLQKEIKLVTEKKLSDLNRQRNDEFQRLHCYFIEMHKDLDEREAQLNQLFNDEIKDIESALMQDLQVVRTQYSDNIRLFKDLKNLYDHFSVSSEAAIVGNSDLAYQLSNKTSQQSQQQATKKFYVQLDEGKQDIATPIFHIHLNNEKDKIMRIGNVLPAQTNDGAEMDMMSQGQDHVKVNFLTKGADSALSMINEESKSIQDSRNVYSIRQSGENFAKSHSRRRKDSVAFVMKDCWTQTGDSGSSLHNNSQPFNNQRLQKQDSMTNGALQTDTTHLSLKNIHWFRWDSNEVYRLNDQTREWTMRSDLKNVSKFLFFSSVVHLPSEQGCFLLGGSDNDDNYSKRVQYFCKYNVFIEKPPMINKRAFFPSVFSKLDNSIYALGGSDSNQNDLNKCEKFSLVENVWRPLASMNLSRNGTAAVILDSYRLIFVIGGNNHKHGSLTKIEKYEIDFDKWSIIDVQLKTAIHDLSAICVGGSKVLIFGGHTNTEPNKEVQMVDLSLECYKSKIGRNKLMLQEGGKTYFPPCFDTQTNKIQMMFGYCDDKPRIEEFDISDLMQQNQAFIGNKLPSEYGSRRNSFVKNAHVNALLDRRSLSANRQFQGSIDI